MQCQRLAKQGQCDAFGVVKHGCQAGCVTIIVLRMGYSGKKGLALHIPESRVSSFNLKLDIKIVNTVKTQLSLLGRC